MQQPPTPRPAPPAGAALFVCGVFALLLAVGLVMVWQYGRNVPYGEDWLFMPALTGLKPLTAGWLWEQTSEHRFPLTRAMLVGLFGLGGGDLRPGMVFNVLATAVAAAALLQTARRLRGYTSYTDAFFPLVLMHPVNAESSLWEQHVTITAPAVVGFALLLLVLRSPASLSLGRAFLLGLCLLLLPLSGGWGFVAAPPLLLWAAYAAVFVWRPRGGGGVVVLAFFVLVTLAVMAVYFVGLTLPPAIKTSPPGQTAEVAVQFLTNGFGPGAEGLWPYSGVAVMALFAATLGLLARPLWRGPHPERARALGLLCVVGGVVLLGLVAGYRRSYNAPYAGFFWRYVWSSAPWLCCAYFAWELYGGPALRPLAQTTLLTLAGFLVGAGTPEAFTAAEDFCKPMDKMEKFLEERGAGGGVPISVFMKEEAGSLYPMLWTDMWLEALRGMRQARVGRFRHLIDDTPYQEFPLPTTPEAAAAMTKAGGRWRGTGAESRLEFALPGQYVCAVVFRFSLTNERGDECYFRASWKKGPGADAGREVQECRVDARDGVTVTVWVCQAVDEIRVWFDEKPFTLHLRAVTLLLPGRSDQ